MLNEGLDGKSMKRVCFLAWGMVILVHGAWSHFNSISFSTIEIKEKEVRMELRYTFLCVLELFQADQNNDQKLSEEELEKISSPFYFYLNNKIKILGGGRQLRMVLKRIRFAIEETDSFVVLDLSFSSQESLDSVIILCNLSEETDSYHRNLSQIKIGEKEYFFIFTNQNYFNSIDPPASRPEFPETDSSAAQPNGS